VLRLAGIPRCESVQCEHRRVEHRVGQHIADGMRRFRPAVRHRVRRARPGFDAAQPLCAAALPIRAHVCAYTYRLWLARKSTCVRGCPRVCARARMNTYKRVGLGAHVSTPNMRALSVGVNRVRFGAQVFSGALAFNTNIGAWNTASVTSMYQVLAACVRRRAMLRTRSAGLRCGAAAVRGSTADARVCAHLNRHSLARVSTRVYV
jgi:surface protein